MGVIAIGELSLFARTYCMRLIRYLFNYDSHIANQSCLDVDAFGLLLTLVLSSPTIVHDIESDTIPLPAVPNGSISDQYFVNLIVVFHCIQVYYKLMIEIAFLMPLQSFCCYRSS